jgi:hypothetical protein
VHLLAGAIVAVAIIYFLIVSPGFQRFAKIILGVFAVVAVIAGVGIYFVIKSEETERVRRAQQYAEYERQITTAIRPEDLSLTDVSLNRSEYRGWVLKGTVTNNSKFGLDKIEFLVTIKSCSANQVCKIIGQEQASAYGDVLDSKRPPLVPAGQVRQFSAPRCGRGRNVLRLAGRDRRSRIHRQHER